ncbi:hypothetical protein HCH_05526 [Hahella chejuensis KCTC 2396]|uniref:Uncharacterized protein n=1 Tax=Hahella chejuensis (strain KCTC 2396) TaxID=349521 RepID=Q2SAY6_HAHCH|nr:hypothetical protein HCH_05526 [Hahella chejuensis KCTC 2396]
MNKLNYLISAWDISLSNAVIAQKPGVKQRRG